MKKVVYNPKQVRLLLLLLLIFAVIFTLRMTRGDTLRTKAFPLVVEVLLVSFFIAVPKLFFPLYRIILILSSYIGSVIFLILSIVVFYVILTPISFIMRLLGKKFMEIEIEPSEATYYKEGFKDHNIKKQF